MVINQNNKDLISQLFFTYCGDCNINLDLAETLFDYCKDCNKMASLPQAAFATCKLRSKGRDTIMARMPKANADIKHQPHYDNKLLMEYTPVKYNSKMMNSIWGFYNRYSPHNIKSNDADDSSWAPFQQQPYAVAGQILYQKRDWDNNAWEFPNNNNRF